MSDSWDGRLGDSGRPPELAPRDEPPADAARRDAEWPEPHDMRPAVGTRGGPAAWEPADPHGDVALAGRRFGDARWSFLFKSRDTRYSAREPADVAATNRRMRDAPLPELQGPFIKPPVWTWQIPLYMWVGGIAAGSSGVAAACDTAGDQRSAAIARRVALGAVAPAAPLLIADLGRPARFLNMLRIFKPRSPMNTGAWALAAFSVTGAVAVGADVAQRPRAARTLGLAQAVIGSYLGSYTGVLLTSTAVPLWARSRMMLAPIFVATATATGAAMTRLVLVASGLPRRHPSRRALSWIETASILSELAMSQVNERRLGTASAALSSGRAGRANRIAKALVASGLAARLASGKRGAQLHDLASVLYLVGGLGFRYAWVEGGRASAHHHEAAAALGRGRKRLHDDGERVPGRRAPSTERKPLPALGRVWTETVRRTSLAIERVASGR